MLLNKSIYSGEEIDVLMPIHNSEKKLLIKSLESIFLQNIRVRLICILNGMSKEKNAEYISLLNKFKCDILISPYKGIACSLNFAISFIKAPYIARQDDDDLSHKNRFKIQKDFLEKNNCDVVGTNIILVDKKDNVIGKRTFPQSDYNCKRQLIYKTCFCHPSIMMKKEFLLNNKYPNLSSEDYALWIKAHEKNIYNNLKEELYFYRRHSNQITNQKNITYLYLRSSLKMISRNNSFKEIIINSIYLTTYAIFYILKKRRIDFNTILF